jgi:predicted helicase
MNYPLYLYETEDNKDEFAFDFNSQQKRERRDGITDFALKLFRSTYSDLEISKVDIFYYTYAVLNSKDFTKNFAQDARKSGPAIPLLKNFESYALIGKKLFDLHLNYDSFAESSKDLGVELESVAKQQKRDAKYRVEKMKFVKDKTGSKDFSQIIFNENINVRNIPKSAYDYSINGRSAIEWVIDQYQFHQDKSTGIISDPNEFHPDQQYALNTLLSVIYVGHETSKLLKSYPFFEVIRPFDKH